MKQVYSLLHALFLGMLPVAAQVSFSGATTPISTGDNAATVVVDNTLAISSAFAINGASVFIASNFAYGDNLQYNPALLPAGVTGAYNSGLGVLTFSGTATAAAYETLLRSVSFTASANGAGDRAIQFTLGNKVPFAANGHFYEYIPGGLSWTAAKANAATRSYFGLAGYLVTITSDAENTYILQKVGADGWIGATDEWSAINAATGTTTYNSQAAAEGNYYWATGPEAGTHFSSGNNNAVAVGGRFTNWNPGEPNNWAGSEHYAQIYMGGSLAGRWNDLSNSGNSTTNGYIIEYGGMPADPVVDLTHSRTIAVAHTVLATTPYEAYFTTSGTALVDNAIQLKSGGLITNANVTISGGFVAGDALSFSSASLPPGTNGSYNATTGVLSFTGTATPAAWQALLRTVTFHSNSGNSADRIISFAVGNLISGSNGHFYEFVPAGNNWSTAQAIASGKTYMGLHGYLATITSKAENDLVFQKLSADGWLGGSDDYVLVNAATGTTNYTSQAASEGKFFWVTGPEKGQPISIGNFPSTTIPAGAFANWYSGEPNNWQGEHFIEMYSSSSEPGHWNDMPHNSGLGSVIEYGGLPTDPGVVLSASRTLTQAIPLRVNDLLLEIKTAGDDVTLNWSVSAAEQVKGYEVLRSNGQQFERIGYLPASGTKGKSVYSFIDAHMPAGLFHYKIAAVDEDGKKTFSAVRSIGLGGQFRVFPTVVTDQITIINPDAAAANVLVVNSSGAVVARTLADGGNTRIAAGNLKKGIYVVHITGSKSAISFMIIKQ